MTDNRAVSRGLKLLCLGQVTTALILLPFPLLRAAAFAAALLLAVAGLYRMGCRVAIPVVLATLAAGLLHMRGRAFLLSHLTCATRIT